MDRWIGLNFEGLTGCMVMELQTEEDGFMLISLRIGLLCVILIAYIPVVCGGGGESLFRCWRWSVSKT